MKKTVLITTLTFNFLLFTFNSLAQPTIQWQKSLGGSGVDGALSFDTTMDGGYIVIGQSNSNDGDVSSNNGNNDYWLVKIDAAGTIQWEKNYGGSGDDVPYSVQQTFDKGYFIAGRTNSNDGDVGINLGGSDMWVLKTDSLGNILWKKSFGGSNSEYVWNAQQTLDSGFVVAGYSNSNDGDVTGNHGFDDYMVVKLDKWGNLQWQKSLGGAQPDQAYSIEQTNDLGYIVVGLSFSTDGDVTGNNGGRDYWIVKLDSIGAMQWQKNYGGSSEDVAFAVQQTQDKGYIVVGSSGSNDGDVTGHHGAIAVDDFWIIKLDSLGNLLWEKSLGGTFVDQATAVKQLNDGGYVILGTSASSDGDVSTNYGNLDCWLVKMDSVGNLIWEKNYGGSFSDWGYGISLTNDAGYIILSQSTSQDMDVTGNHGSVDFWMVKLNAVVGIEELENKLSIKIYPNPTNQFITINTPFNLGQFQLFNLLGQQLLTKEVQEKTTVINLQQFAKGAYLLKYITKDKLITKKIILK